MDKVTALLIVAVSILLGGTVTPFIVNFRYPPVIRRSLTIYACANLVVAVGYLIIIIFNRTAPLFTQLADLGAATIGTCLFYFSVRSLLERSFHLRPVGALAAVGLLVIVYGCGFIHNLNLGLLSVCAIDIVLFGLMGRDLLFNFSGRGRTHLVMGAGCLGFAGLVALWGVALVTGPLQSDLIIQTGDASFYVLAMACVGAALGTINFLLLCNDEFNTRLLVFATTDALTGIANRRRLMERGAEEIARAERYGHPLSVVIVDLDYFKKLNDTYGHATGDLALRAAAQAWVKALRDIDLVARSGGEEFAVLLPQTILARAVEVAERLRNAVAALEIPGPSGPVKITASLGVAQFLRQDGSLDRVLARADQALYRSKADGRNRVSFEVNEEQSAITTV